MKLVVGLGNPGLEYALTRHNIGFMAADRLVRLFDLESPKSKFSGQLFSGETEGQKVLVLKPATFMNLSGKAVAECAAFYKIPPEDILVLQDELDLPFGEVRMKHGGGNAGHNGLKSIEASLGTNTFARLRMGIEKKDVLGIFNKSEQEKLPEILDLMEQKAKDWIKK